MIVTQATTPDARRGAVGASSAAPDAALDVDVAPYDADVAATCSPWTIARSRTSGRRFAYWGPMTTSTSGARRSRRAPSCWATQPATTMVTSSPFRFRFAWGPT